MSRNSSDIQDQSIQKSNEEDIFKLLSHELRRQIVYYIGTKGKAIFSEIRHAVNDIDSSMLSYHLKNLKTITIQKKGFYFLSEIGKAAFFILEKTDQSNRIKKYKKKFLYAYITTVLCWILVMTIIPILYLADLNGFNLFWITIVLNIISITNYIVVLSLQKRY